MNQVEIKKKTILGLMWRFMERCGAQGVTFVVSIILARILDPEVYGTIALVTVFTAILQVFVDSGLGNALIQKKDADQLDFSTVFYFNIAACLVVYALIFFAAPYISKFYANDELESIVRVLGLTVVVSAIKNVQQSYVFRNMLYRKFFFSTLGGTIGAAIIGVTAAYLNCGVWALVLQQLFNMIVDTIILWFTVQWRPTREFSVKRLKMLFGYGWKLMASSLLHTVYTNLRSLIIGKMYTTEDLAFYDKGQSFPALVVTNINTSIDSVLFPAMSDKQKSPDAIRSMTRRAIATSSYIMWPMMIGLAVVARPLLTLLLTEKWLPAVPYLQIGCMVLAFEPMQTANLNAIKAMGRSDVYLKLEIIKKSISLGILLVAMKYGVISIAFSGLIYAILATMINSYPNSKLLDYPYLEQVKDVIPSASLAVLMGLIVYPISMLHLPVFVILILQVIVGAFTYVGISHVFKLEPYMYLKNTIFEMIKGR